MVWFKRVHHTIYITIIHETVLCILIKGQQWNIQLVQHERFTVALSIAWFLMMPESPLRLTVNTIPYIKLLNILDHSTQQRNTWWILFKNIHELKVKTTEIRTAFLFLKHLFLNSDGYLKTSQTCNYLSKYHLKSVFFHST